MTPPLSSFRSSPGSGGVSPCTNKTEPKELPQERVSGHLTTQSRLIRAAKAFGVEMRGQREATTLVPVYEQTGLRSIGPYRRIETH